MFTKFVITLVAIFAFGMGCSNDQPTAPDMSQSADSSQADVALSKANHWWHGDHNDHNNMVTFTVRVENVSTAGTLHLSNGETAPAPNSPGVWTVTRLFNPLFKIGRYDLGIGMEQQAEDGDPTMLAASMEQNPWVKSTGVFAIPVGDDSPGPATPGKYFEFTIMAGPGDHLSLSSMFGQSNDLFYSPGAVGIPLFKWGRKPISGDVTRYFRLWDAGTEVNQEPGIGPDQAPRQSAPNTGESEHKRVLPVHDQYTYPRTNEVIKVTITPASDIS